MHPYLLHTGHLYLPTFGALAAIGVMLALTLSERTARMLALPPESVWNAGIFAVISAFVFSRMLLVFMHFEMFRRFPLLLLAVPSLTPTGFVLSSLATYLFLQKTDLPVLRTLDAWSPCAALVWFFLALGHFAEGSDLGLPATHGLRLPGETVATSPVALYAAAFAALLTLLLLFLLRSTRPPGQVAGLALVFAGLAQYFLTFMREPGLALLGGLDALEWLALGMIATGSLLFADAARRPHVPSGARR